MIVSWCAVHITLLLSSMRRKMASGRGVKKNGLRRPKPAIVNSREGGPVGKDPGDFQRPAG